eukprot:s978_g25.t2
MFCEETEENKKYLQAVEFEEDQDMIELDCRLHAQSMEDDDLLEASNNVQTLIHFLKSNIEFRVEYSAQFWTLENKSSEFLTEAQMIPNTVQIKVMEGIPTIAKIWRGCTEEANSHSKEIGKRSGSSSNRGPRPRGQPQQQPSEPPGEQQQQRWKPYRRSDFDSIFEDVPAIEDDAEIQYDDPEQEQENDDDKSDDDNDSEHESENDDNDDNAAQQAHEDLESENDETIEQALAALGGFGNDEADVAPDEQVVLNPDPDAEVLDALDLNFVRRATGQRREGVSELRCGQLRYNVVSEFMRAHCEYHVDCHRQRAVKGSAGKTKKCQGQGRCLGTLLAWLDSGKDYDTKAAHQKAASASKAIREEARRKFTQTREGREFAQHERDKRAGEGDEPDDIR